VNASCLMWTSHVNKHMWTSQVNKHTLFGVLLCYAGLLRILCTHDMTHAYGTWLITDKHTLFGVLEGCGTCRGIDPLPHKHTLDPVLHKHTLFGVLVCKAVEPVVGLTLYHTNTHLTLYHTNIPCLVSWYAGL